MTSQGLPVAQGRVTGKGQWHTSPGEDLTLISNTVWLLQQLGLSSWGALVKSGSNTVDFGESGGGATTCTSSLSLRAWLCGHSGGSHVVACCGRAGLFVHDLCVGREGFSEMGIFSCVPAAELL